MIDKQIAPTDITLLKTAWQLSLAHIDNEFGISEIEAELERQGWDWDYINAPVGVVIRMLDLGLIEVREIGSLYRCTWACSSSSTIELTIVPFNDALHEDVLKEVTKAVEKFGELVDVEDD